MPLPVLEPMLATAARRLAPGEWAVEPKLDGWRALVYADGRLVVRTRRGRDVTACLPELAEPPPGLAGRRVVLDGELVAGAGLPGDFYAVGARLASDRRPRRLAFAAFDVLHLDGEALLGAPYRERRRALVELGLASPTWCTVASFTGDLGDVLTAVAEHRLEGVVLKRADSPYRPGSRSKLWVKLKLPEWHEVHGPRRHP